ncbi:MAG: choice-of-anchor J domain-containing protein [Candidatus Delongbacteria bacterium]|nr:choice-of-anchor J domain-containing protein [Candidatus Delongbacteria bacterium]
MKKMIVMLLLFAISLTFGASFSAMSVNNSIQEVITKSEQIINYDGEPAFGIGTDGPITFTPAIRLTADELEDHYGKNISKVQLCIIVDAFSSVTLKVYEGSGSNQEPGNLLLSQLLNVIVGSMNEYTLDTPILLEDGKDYWIGYEIVATGSKPASSDAGSVFEDGKSNLVFIDGEWTTLLTLSTELNYNWNIRVVVDDEVGPDITAPTIVSLTGNHGQPDTELNLTLAIADQSETPSMIDAIYNICGMDYSFSMSKVSKNQQSVYSGVIPPQPAGTEGSVRFLLSDLSPAGNSVWSEEIIINWLSPAVYIINENFDSAVAPELPEGWTVVDANGDGKQWIVSSVGNSMPFGLRMDYNSSVNMDDWVFTPPFTPNPQKKYMITYSYKSQSDFFNEKFEIKYGTDTTPNKMINTIVKPIVINNDEYITDSTTFVPSSNEAIVIGFHGISDMNNFWLYFDDISVKEIDLGYDNEAPVVFSINGTEEITGNEMNITIEVEDQSGVSSVEGFYKFNGNDTWINMQMNNSKVWNSFTGVIPMQEEAKEGKVKFVLHDTFTPSNSGESQEFDIKWINSANVQVYDFEEGIPTGWTIIDADGDGYNWTTEPSIPCEVHSGSKGVHSASFINTSKAALNPDNYIIMDKRLIEQNASIKFWVSAQDGDWSAEHYGIAISTSSTNPSDFTMIYEETLTAKGHGSWYERQVIIPENYVGQNVYIAFRHFDCTDMFWINLDDVTVNFASPTKISGELLPQETTLHQNYPNPFNPTTTINFTTNVIGEAIISIINVKGELVDKFTEKILTSGKHSIIFDGSKLNSGVYFYRLETGDYSSTKKMILVK